MGLYRSPHYALGGLNQTGQAQLDQTIAQTEATAANTAATNAGRVANAAGLQMQMAQMSPSSYHRQIMQGLEANRGAIDNRYGQAMAGMDAAANQQMQAYLAATNGMGDASRDRIYRDANAARNSVGAQLAGTGLYNSTVMGSMQSGVDRDRNEALASLDEQLRRERSNTLNEITTRALDRQMQLSQGQLSSLGSMASQQAQMDMALRGNARDTSAITPAILNLIAGQQIVPTTRKR